METHEAQHGVGSHGGGGGHASVGFFWVIAAALAVLTAVEVAVFYIPALGAVLVPVLLVLSAVKFAMVVMFFMHLRFDSKIYSGLFLAGLLLAVLMVTGLVLLYHYVPELQA